MKMDVMADGFIILYHFQSNALLFIFLTHQSIFSVL